MKNKKLKKRNENEGFQIAIDDLNNTSFKKTKFLRTDNCKNKDLLVGYFSMSD